MKTTDTGAAYVQAYSCRACRKNGSCKDLKAGVFCKFALTFAGIADKQQTLTAGAQ